MIASMIPIFLTVFLAELGDKTQLATVLYAAESGRSPWMVFAAASLALVCSSAVGVLAGHYAAAMLQQLPLKLIAGIGFILIGIWTLYGHFSTS